MNALRALILREVSQTEKNIHDLSGNLKNDTNLITTPKQTHRHREQIYGYERVKEADSDIHLGQCFLVFPAV